ncbi:hypothetical protein TNCV_1598381 [Trichonephila clavipes]|nr:hypothetical protein TNCV_1598381 [Trichonephila clavipes]
MFSSNSTLTGFVVKVKAVTESPVVRVAVEPQQPLDLPKLVDDCYVWKRLHLELGSVVHKIIEGNRPALPKSFELSLPAEDSNGPFQKSPLALLIVNLVSFSTNFQKNPDGPKLAKNSYQHDCQAANLATKNDANLALSLRFRHPH